MQCLFHQTSHFSSSHLCAGVLIRGGQPSSDVLATSESAQSSARSRPSSNSYLGPKTHSIRPPQPLTTTQISTWFSAVCDFFQFRRAYQATISIPGTKNCSDVALDNAAAPSSFNYSEPQTIAFLGSTSDSAGLAVRCPKTDASLQALPSPPSVKVPSPILGAAGGSQLASTTVRLTTGHISFGPHRLLPPRQTHMLS